MQHPPPRPRASEPPTGYAQFGKHRLRAPIGIVVDTPIPITGGWVGTIWPNPTAAPDENPWSRHCWEPDHTGGRGWLIPDRLALADIVEFGSDPTGAQRWYGIVDSYDAGQWLTLQGPYPTPQAAYQAAQDLFAANCHTAATPPRATRGRSERCRAHTTRRRT